MHNPFDRFLKLLAESDPRALLDLVGELPLDAPAEVEALEREVGAPPLFVDHLYTVKTLDRCWLSHFEFLTWWKADVLERGARQLMAAYLTQRLPIRSTVVLLKKEQAPAVVPVQIEIDAWSLRIRYQFHVAKLWECDAAKALSTGRPSLLPFVPLMRGTEQQAVEALNRIVRGGDEQLAIQFQVLGGLRYDKGLVRSWMETANMPLSKEILMESSVIQWLVEEGREEGRAGGAARMVRRLLERRFPGLDIPPHLDSLTVQKLEDLMDRVLAAKDASEARCQLEAAIYQAPDEGIQPRET